MDRRSFPFLMAAAVLLPSLILACCTGAGRKSLPCDIYRSGGTPCVAAHSTTRLLDSKYHGPLYRVQRESDGMTLDIRPDAAGYSDAAAQDRFLEGTLGRITVIFDQSGMGNDLVQASPGTFLGPETGGFNTLPIADMAPALLDGHKVYGAYIMPGMGFRCNNARGLAIDDEPEGIYYVIDGGHYDSGCCFDYGNSSTNGRAVGTGTMETTYYGTSTAWGRGNGDGPWIMSDMEAGLFSGYDAKLNDVPSITDWDFVSVFVNGGGGNKWDLRGGDAAKDSLVTFYSGPRPHSPQSDAYYPMHKKGGMLLGNGGDNGNGSAGTFFEGVMTSGYPTDETIAKVQGSIAAARYRKYPLSVSRMTSFVPGGKSEVSVAFTNTTGKPVKGLSFSVDLPDGWKAECVSEAASGAGVSDNVSSVFSVTAPESRSAGFIRFNASWKGGSVSLTERVRAVEPVKINEVGFPSALGRTSFVELYNGGPDDADLSGVDVIVRRSGWAPVKAFTFPDGTIMGPGEFLTLEQSASAVTAPASKGSSEVHLLYDLSVLDNIEIGGFQYGIIDRGTPAGEFTTVFTPVSTGPWVNIPAGSESIPVTSTAGFVPGEAMGIGLGGDYEIVTVTEVGTPSTQSILSEAASAGATRLVVETTRSLVPGSLVTVDTGDRMEVVTVKELVRSSDPPAPRRFGQPQQVHEPGIIELEEPLKKDHAVSVDVSCPGSGISFKPATRFSHISGESVQPLGAPYKLDEPFRADVPAWAPVGLPSGLSAVRDLLRALAGRSDDDLRFGLGYAPSNSAGSISLVDPATGAVLDAIVYGSQQSNSSANGTITSPELATLEGVQDGGGCIAVLPPLRPSFGPGGSISAPTLYRSLVRYPDGSDTDNLCRDFRLCSLPTPGMANTVEME
ncbi:MAG: lamin tail domain-containing protein [Bacteroidales bacterium]|nr:lamin tail domain-containing protein [Bacteroidales bacterium]